MSKLLKYTVCSLLFALYFSSCSENLDFSRGILNTVNDDYISVDIFIPQEKYVDTRAAGMDPNEISGLTVFVYNGTTLVQKKEIYGSELIPDGLNQYKLNIEKNDEAKKAESLNIYIVANPGNTLDTATSVNDIESAVDDEYYSTDGFYMAGKADVTSHTSVELTRAAGKITVENKTGNDKFQLTGFHIYGSANDCFVAAGETEQIRDGNKQDFINLVKEPFTEAGYSKPSHTHKLVAGKDPEIFTYIVVEGTFDNKPSFYALPLYSQSKDTHFDINPNHWYELVLEEVNHAGQPSRDEAVKNPCDYVIYDIHDHTPEILSMASDGVHELGVTHDIELQPDKGIYYTNTFTVKIYSARTEEELDFGEVDIQIISGGDWMEIANNPQEVKPDENLSDSDKALFGVQYKFTVTNQFERYTAQTGTIRVTWKGLERDVNVSYNPQFQMDKACTGTLYIKDDSGQTKYTIEKYWAFLQGDNDNWTLYGVGSNDMAEGKVRNQGFHFPMPYGNDVPNKTWTYEYDVNFRALQEQLNGEEITGITATISGNAYFTNNLDWSYDHDSLTGHLKLKNATPSNYEYATGRIVFTVNYGDNSTRAFTLNLYHTGFFHHDDGFTYDGENVQPYMASNEFYYYEVVQMEGTYWLDRNVGAKSNKMFVDDGGTGLGNSDAKGQYLKICKYVEGAYEDPNVINEMCPPGYHIPVSSEWNAIRLSSNFQTAQETDENNISYSATYYQSSIGKIYFPRAKYYHSNDNKPIVWHQDNANMGDASTGYYWTATAAPGMEKLEMGKWLRALYLNGASTTYMNTDVVTSKLNVRCVAGASIPSQDNHYVSINVHNVTHVYLFDTTSGNALYTFPGHAVGTDASSQRWQNFTCTTSADISHIGMIFVKESINGGITIFTKDGNSFEIHKDMFSQTVREATADSNKYWPVEIGKYYDFCYEKIVEGNDTPIDLIQKRKEAGVSNVSDTQPDEDYCSYDENAESSNSGTVIPPSYQFNKEYDEEVDFNITPTEFNSGWGNNDQLKAYMWANVTVGSKIKVYVTPTGGDLILQTFADWSQMISEYRIGQMHRHIDGSDVYVLEIDVTEYLLSLVQTKGMIFNGTNMILLGVTIYEGDSGPVTPMETIYDSHEGYWPINNGGSWDDLASPPYDWSQIKEGDVLTFIIDVYWYGDAQLKLLYKNTRQPLTGYTGFSFSTNGNYIPVSITLTQDMINGLQNNGGLSVESVQIALRQIMIRRPIE